MTAASTGSASGALPVVVLTHFHADHVDGLAAVLDGRRVGGGRRDRHRGPGVRRGRGAPRGRRPRGCRCGCPPYGEVRAVGPLTWQVVGPVAAAAGGESTARRGRSANNASLVLLVEVRGRADPDGRRHGARGAAARWHASLPGLRVDVLKVPHHGSRYQDPDLLDGLGARLAVVSVGRDNDYGHPAPRRWRCCAGRGCGSSAPTRTATSR